MPLALVTGASGKLGKIIAQHLSKRGYSLVLHGCTRSPEVYGQDDRVILSDLSTEEGLAPLVSLLSDGSISLLINSASSFQRINLSSLRYVDLVSTFSLNCFAPILLMQALARGLTARHKTGLVINLLDTKVQLDHSFYSAYTLSKKALASAGSMALVEFSAVLRINAIAPKYVITDDALVQPDQTESGLDLVTCLDRLIDTPEINNACLLLDGSQLAL